MVFGELPSQPAKHSNQTITLDITMYEARWGPTPGSQYDVLPPGEDDKQQSMVQEAKDITLHGKIQS